MTEDDLFSSKYETHFKGPSKMEIILQNCLLWVLQYFQQIIAENGNNISKNTLNLILMTNMYDRNKLRDSHSNY